MAKTIPSQISLIFVHENNFNSELLYLPNFIAVYGWYHYEHF